MVFLDPNGLFGDWDMFQKLFFWTSHTFEFSVIQFGHFFLEGLYESFLGYGYGSTAAFGSTHTAEKFLFSLVPSILTFDFYHIFVSSFGPKKAILGSTQS